ncbi:MAG: hypothetical protein LBK73_16830 [Treponema sp.]|jgi:hypothetical protein|nr:hypothetical protein [Treponema sp.]
MNMVMDSFERANGFSVLTADELFFVNGGSGAREVIGLGRIFTVATKMGDGTLDPQMTKEVFAAMEAAQKVAAYNDQGYYDYSLGGNPH